jgi:hypothetical protein
MRQAPAPASVISAAALLALASCIMLPGTRSWPTPSTADRREPPPAPTLKEVFDKEPPGTLRARDGSVCLVTEERFHKTRVGDRVWCDWH